MAKITEVNGFYQNTFDDLKKEMIDLVDTDWNTLNVCLII